MKFQILFEVGDIHDATVHYVNIIERSLLKFESTVEIISSIKQIDRKTNIIVVVNAKAHVRVLLKNPRQKVIVWYQGIMPEEINVLYKGFNKKLKSWFWTALEYISLRISAFSLFVSDEMRYHYERKYKINFTDKYYVMPCFNLKLDRSAFTIPDKYTTPNFVYAGTMSKWQCIELMLKLFKQIQVEIPKAKLYIFTSDRRVAENYLQKYELSNVTVDYIPYQKIGEKLKKMKYGFILRENIAMNRVSTPTKMNTYLANGIIPIYSNYIEAFRTNLLNLEYQIATNNNDDFTSIIKKIKVFEEITDLNIDIKNDFENNAFTSFYNQDFHITNLFKKLKKHLK